jgi:hypothetical protein
MIMGFHAEVAQGKAKSEDEDPPHESEDATANRESGAMGRTAHRSRQPSVSAAGASHDVRD